MLKQGERRRLAQAAAADLAALAKRQKTLNRRQNTRTDAGLALKADATGLDALELRVDTAEGDIVSLEGVVAALQAEDIAHDGRLDALEAALPLKLEWTSVPASAAATGTAGQIAYESGFLYVCVAIDTWQRVAVATWP